MTIEYIHDKLGQAVESIAGYYMPTQELRLEYNDREVLCVLGSTRVESSHYLTGGGPYAQIPGYIVRWKFKQSADGRPVSEVEPIKDEDTRRNISAVINDIEPVKIIDFW